MHSARSRAGMKKKMARTERVKSNDLDEKHSCHAKARKRILAFILLNVLPFPLFPQIGSIMLLTLVPMKEANPGCWGDPGERSPHNCLHDAIARVRRQERSLTDPHVTTVASVDGSSANDCAAYNVCWSSTGTWCWRQGTNSKELRFESRVKEGVYQTFPDQFTASMWCLFLSEYTHTQYFYVAARKVT